MIENGLITGDEENRRYVSHGKAMISLKPLDVIKNSPLLNFTHQTKSFPSFLINHSLNF